MANNVQIGVPVLSGSNLSFSISWENSWYISTGPANWDAVWIFVKYQDCADNLWQHAGLSTTGSDHSVTTTTVQVDVVSDGKGVYIRRSGYGQGTIATATLTVKLTSGASASNNYQVFGIEMVQIPQGDFYVGDGTGGSLGYGFGDATYAPVLITNNIQNVTGITAAALGPPASTGLPSQALPITFPMGWNSFYCMKYEISQEQYMRFLNSLSYDQQVYRSAASPNSSAGTQALSGGTVSRNGVKIQISGTPNNIPAIYMCDLNGNGTANESTDGQNVACNWLKFSDILAYLDWAALRPMTELEFEKVCRGSLSPVAYELAWGSATILQTTSSSLNNSGANNETSTISGVGLCAYNAASTSNGPLRCGFAATATTNRSQSGGSYYGVMDMTGNVVEMALNVNGGNLCCGHCAAGVAPAFTNATGDGTLTWFGDANSPLWSTNSTCWMPRGGDWYDSSVLPPQTSDRINANEDNYTFNIRTLTSGGRGVR